jgi:hypothetical protein
MKNIIKNFCETYGIDFDFGTNICNNLKKININEINKKNIPELNSNRMIRNKFSIFNNSFMHPRKGSVDESKAQLKIFQHFPKQRQAIVFTKTSKEKDIEELIPKNFEINDKLMINKNIINNNNKLEDNSIDNSKLPLNTSFQKKDNLNDYELSLIKVIKKETINEFGNQNYIKDNNFDNSQNNLNSDQININTNINKNSNK